MNINKQNKNWMNEEKNAKFSSESRKKVIHFLLILYILFPAIDEITRQNRNAPELDCLEALHFGSFNLVRWFYGQFCTSCFFLLSNCYAFAAGYARYNNER